MGTIPRKWPKRWRGQRVANCDTCGARYPSGKLRRGRDGLLRCIGPGTLNDAKGAVALELDEANAAGAMDQQRGDYLDDGGNYDFGVD
jgi:hypothetical protein